MKPYWSNCAIEAFKAKVRDWRNIRIIPIWHGWIHFHVMWLDKRTGKVLHFTHKSLPGWHCDLFFKGRIEEVDKVGLRKWCKSHNAIATGLP